MPPRSTNAPYSVRFLTTPARTGSLLQAFEQRLALGRVLLLYHRPARDHHIVAAAVELDDLELERLSSR